MDIFNFPAQLIEKGLNPDNFSNQQKVELLEYFIRRDMEDISGTFPLKHHLCNGVYIREILLPKNTLTIGKVHKTEHQSYIAFGDVSVMTDSLTRIKAPCMFVSPAGTKRAVWAHEDATWFTYHRTDNTDIKEIEDEMTYNSDLSWVKLLENMT